MEFMTLKEILERAGEIRAAFEDLVGHRKLVIRKDAAQWRFFRHCLERTLGFATEIPAYDPVQLAQYKFEVEDKLRHFYLGPGRPVAFVFKLAHLRETTRNQWLAEPEYPNLQDYYLLVRDLGTSRGCGDTSPQEVAAYIEKVVTACIDAEFEAYQSLPAVDEPRLQRWFRQGSPAYRDLILVLTRLSQRGWVLTNPYNPSTKRLLSIEVKEVRGGRAVVRTTEYWYLRWWSPIENKYRYPYRETNRQTYILVETADGWLVEENIRPAPRTSAPHRQK